MTKKTQSSLRVPNVIEMPFYVYVWCTDNVEMADLKKLEDDAVGFAQQAITFDQQGLHDMAFFYYCVSMILFIITHTCFYCFKKYIWAFA